MKTRFAPSPTGLMHFGNVRTALFNFLLAKQMGGDFVLRVEDTDQERSKPEFYKALLQDLEWLGLEYQNSPYKQSERSEIYGRYYNILEEAGKAYPCFCSESQLAMTRKAQLASGQPPRYSGVCRNLTTKEIDDKLQAGLKATLRFHVIKDEIIEFDDLVKGKQRFSGNDIGDFIIRRADGTASFMFCNAIDDPEMGITHALRGEDHLTNTPRQLMILKTLGLQAPTYGHFPMIYGQDGAPLSKRNGSQSVDGLRKQGSMPMAILNYLARLGHYYEINDFLTIEGLAKNFDLKRINTAPARHDPMHLKHWQKETILHTDINDFRKIIDLTLVPNDKKDFFAEIMQANILVPDEAQIWAKALFAKTIEYIDDLTGELSFFKHALEIIEELVEPDFQEFTKQLKEKTGCKGKSLFIPLRVALTGNTSGPEMVKIFDIMDKDIMILRFQQAIDMAS